VVSLVLAFSCGSFETPGQVSAAGGVDEIGWVWAETEVVDACLHHSTIDRETVRFPEHKHMVKNT